MVTNTVFINSVLYNVRWLCLSCFKVAYIFSYVGLSSMALTASTIIGGYDHNFISSPPDRLVCSICQYPSQDPHLSVCCGQVFCKSCLDGVKRAIAFNANACPVCREKDFVTFPNKQTSRSRDQGHSGDVYQ